MKSIQTDVTVHDVTIKMLGCQPITLLRPPSVTLSEWYSYWGNMPSRSTGGNYGQPFTQEDVAGNNKRRLQFMEEQNGKTG